MNKIEGVLKIALEELEIPIEEFNNYTEDDIKRQWRRLVVKYHPDLHKDESFLKKTQAINKAKETIDNLVKNGIIKLKEKDNYQSTQENNFNSTIRLYERLNILYKKVVAAKNNILEPNKLSIINAALELNEEIMERINIASTNSNDIYDFGILSNYVELFEFFYFKTNTIQNKYYIFSFYHSNHVNNVNDKYDKLKEKICLVHKQLLCNEIKKL